MPSLFWLFLSLLLFYNLSVCLPVFVILLSLSSVVYVSVSLSLFLTVAFFFFSLSVFVLSICLSPVVCISRSLALSLFVCHFFFIFFPSVFVSSVLFCLFLSVSSCLFLFVVIYLSSIFLLCASPFPFQASPTYSPVPIAANTPASMSSGRPSAASRDPSDSSFRPCVYIIWFTCILIAGNPYA